MRAPVFLFVHTSLCVRLFFLLACASALGSVFACLVFGGEPVLPPVCPLALATSVLLACLKACLFCVGLFAVRFVRVQNIPHKSTRQGVSCGRFLLWPKRRARRDVELCWRACAALGKRQKHKTMSKRTVNTLREWTQSCHVGFGAACFLVSLRGPGGQEKKILLAGGALRDPPSSCSFLFFLLRLS